MVSSASTASHSPPGRGGRARAHRRPALSDRAARSAAGPARTTRGGRDRRSRTARHPARAPCGRAPLRCRRATIKLPSTTTPPPTPVPSVSSTRSPAPRAPPAATRRWPRRWHRSRSPPARRAAAHPVAEGDLVERDVDRPIALPGPLVDPRRDAEPDARDLPARAAPRPAGRGGRAAPPATSRRSCSTVPRPPSRRRDDPGEDLRPAEVHPDHPRCRKCAGTIRRRMSTPAERSPIASTGAGGRKGGCRRQAACERVRGRRPRETGAAATGGRGPKATARIVRRVRWGRE